MIMETNQVAPIRRSYWLGKLFSLVGIVPLGIYVILHLYNNLRSLYGEESFNQHLAQGRSMPLIVPLTILVIWIPIAFHGLYGLIAMKKSRPNLGRFRYFDNLKYVIQRLSGIGLLLFIPAHVFKTRIEPGLEGKSLDFLHMAEGLHEPLTLTIYILGVLGVAYHLANGIWQFSIGWGLATSQRGMNRVQILSFVVFVALLVMGYGAIWGFIRG
jgi:succinate dehydrogenase / fumarate reductase cytochrome b subunit